MGSSLKLIMAIRVITTSPQSIDKVKNSAAPLPIVDSRALFCDVNDLFEHLFISDISISYYDNKECGGMVNFAIISFSVSPLGAISNCF